MSHPRPSKGRRRATGARATALFGVGALLTGAGLAGLAPGTATASSHREAPGILDDPQYDNTDLYAFNSPDKSNSVTIIANWNPFEEPAGGPNYFPWATDARYDVRIDNDHDAKADIIYRWTFHTSRRPKASDSFTGNGTFLTNNGQVTSLNDPNLLFRQTYDLTRITVGKGKHRLLHNAPVAPSYVGDVSMPNYTSLRDAAISRYGHGRSSFAGQAEDPFFLDLRVFDLLYGDQGTCNKEIGNDTLAGYNVNSIALQVPKSDLTRGSEPVVGIWSTTERWNSKHKYVQISRLGQPLVNEAIIPYQLKNTVNASHPSQDGAALPVVEKPELASLLKNVCGVNAPTDHRDDLVAVFLTGVKGINQPKHLKAPSEQLRLNTTKFAHQKTSRLGVIGGDNNGFPNGRRLRDDVVDIALQVVGGELAGDPNNLGDAVNRNDASFGRDFPYLALPLSGSVDKSSPAAKSGQTLLTGGADAPTGGGFPTGEVGLIGLGVLALVAGAAAARRAGASSAPATAAVKA